MTERTCDDLIFIIDIRYPPDPVLPRDKDARMPVGDMEVAVMEEITGGDRLKMAQGGLKPSENPVDFLL